MNYKLLNRIQERRKLFSKLLPPIQSTGGTPSQMPNTCPACGYPTLKTRNNFEICEICFWEDWGIDDFEPAYSTKFKFNDLFILQEYRRDINENLENFKKTSQSGDPEFFELKNKILLLDKIESDLHHNHFLIELFLNELQSLTHLLNHYRYKTFENSN